MDRTSLALLNLADRLASVETKVTNLSRPQLAHSSIVDGAIDQVKLVDTGELDPNGFPIFAEEVVARLGEQEDGGNGVSVFNGPVPPRPVNFSVVGGPGLLTVEWLGELEDRFEPYSDHAYVNVHISTVPDFTPDASTIKAAIISPQGEQVTISGLDPAPYYVTLVSVSQAGIWSLPAPFDGDDATSQVDPVWVQSIEDKANEAVATSELARSTAEAARERAEAAKAEADAASAAANAADAKAIEAQASADVALTTASGKAKVMYSQQRPPHVYVWGVDGKDMELEPDLAEYTPTDGEVWYVRDVDPTWLTEVVHEHWVYNADRQVWIKHELRDEVIASLTAGKLTTGTLSAATTITVGATDTTHLKLGQSSLQVFRPDGDGGVTQTISIGGADRDVMLITDPDTGSTIAGFDGDGNAIASTMNVYSDLYVGGVSLGDPNDPEDVLWGYPRGIIAGFLVDQDSPQTSGTTTMGVAEVMATCVAGRRYRAVFEGNVFTSAAGLTRMFQFWTTNGSRPWLNPAPAGQSQLGMGFINGVVNGHQRARLETHFFVGANQGDIDVRVLLALQKLGGGYANLHSDGGSTPGYLYIEDLGPVSTAPWGQGAMSTGGAATSSGGTYTPPTAGVKTFTKTYNATWSGGWRGSSAYSGSEIRQGYSSGQLQSAIGFPSSILSDVSGGVITKIEVYLYANHWYYNSGGTLVIGAHGATSRPASFPSGSATTTRQWRTKSGGLWVTLPESWYPYWLSGSSRGITIGNAPPAGSSNSYYARLNGYGMSYAPQLRVTYTK